MSHVEIFDTAQILKDFGLGLPSVAPENPNKHYKLKSLPAHLKNKNSTHKSSMGDLVKFAASPIKQQNQLTPN